MSAHPMRNRRIAITALGVAVVAVAILLLTRPSDDARTVSAEVPNAGGIARGQELREAGQTVGRVTKVEPTRSGRARLRFQFEKDHWPVPAGTRFSIRTPSTIALGGRYVDVRIPAERGGRNLREDEALPSRDVVAPVEFDRAFTTFDGTRRRRLRVLVDRGGAVMRRARGALRSTLDETPPALVQTNKLLVDLRGSQQTLTQLLRSTDDVSAAINRSNPGVGELLQNASSTLEAIESRSQALRSGLRQAPATLRDARVTLGRASTTLDDAERLTGRLSGGIARLRRITPPLNRTLTTVDDVGPNARRALTVLSDASPQVSTLLDRVRGLAPELRSIGTEGAKQLNCIRPYAPEVAGTASNWSGFLQFSDGLDKVARITAATLPFPNATPLTSKQVMGLFPQISPQWLRPAGALSGQPYMQPECGKTAEDNKAENDPDNRG